MARFDLTDFEWSVIAPLLPNKVRGVKRVDDRRVLNGICWRLRTGAPWADIPERYGPHTTCVNRFNRWRKAGVWDRILQAVSKAYDGKLQMIDSSSIRVHQHAANRVCVNEIGLNRSFKPYHVQALRRPLDRITLRDY
jgi:putative transposase